MPVLEKTMITQCPVAGCDGLMNCPKHGKHMESKEGEYDEESMSRSSKL
jgi:hypothetical protein